jgi:hypothetical protein
MFRSQLTPQVFLGRREAVSGFVNSSFSGYPGIDKSITAIQAFAIVDYNTLK